MQASMAKAGSRTKYNPDTSPEPAEGFAREGMNDIEIAKCLRTQLFSVQSEADPIVKADRKQDA
jgi:hypothetical protein